MDKEFRSEAMTLLLGLGSSLTKIEVDLLTVLRLAADGEIYWDTLGRFKATWPDFHLVLSNIATKARAAGLVPQLEALKEKHNESVVEAGA
jgi:hypothetical protein